MTALAAPDHVAALVVVAGAAAVIVVAARTRPGAWLKVFAAVLVVDEVSWWVYLLAGGVPGSVPAQSLPLQLCDVAVFMAAAALWTRRRLLVEVTWFWGLAGTVQALLTPDLPQGFPAYPYWQYYIAHGGVVAAALALVVGMRLHPRPRAVFVVAGLTLAYAGFVAAIDALTGANYMYLRAKPAAATLLDAMGPWPVYIGAAALVAAAFFAILDAPFRLGRRRALRTAATAPGR